ncbi:MAG: ATP-binding cassette domain-containing protein, partial [Deltaproteobacteria bacterium]|nr:ATP-binding cassette domain-containing protein [Deltaproteobacteria bacterium]
MEKDIYRLEGVSFKYGDSFALKEISLTVRPGESIAILGANGSGKSTLLKV